MQYTIRVAHAYILKFYPDNEKRKGTENWIGTEEGMVTDNGTGLLKSHEES